MNKEKMKEILKKCFGKQKDDRWHAVAMLIIYGIFFIFVFIFINTLPKDVSNQSKLKPTPTPTPTIVENYNYDYTVIYDDMVHVYKGKKLDNKETFTYTDGENTNEYAIIDKALYVITNGNYEKVNSFNLYYKYLNRDKILRLIDYNKCINNDNNYVCDIDSKRLASIFEDILPNSDDVTNPVFIVKNNDEVKSIKLELDNYISSITKEEHKLSITMEYNYNQEGNE